MNDEKMRNTVYYLTVLQSIHYIQYQVYFPTHFHEK